MADKSDIPTGYAETMDKLKAPDSWDVRGIVADAAEDLRRHSDNGQALAVIDRMLWTLQEIHSVACGDHHAFPHDRAEAIRLMCEAYTR